MPVCLLISFRSENLGTSSKLTIFAVMASHEAELSAIDSAQSIEGHGTGLYHWDTPQVHEDTRTAPLCQYPALRRD